MQCIQLHGLVQAGTGLSGAAPLHEILPCGPINALISTISRPVTPDELTPQEIADLAMRHNAILMAYCDKTTVIPMALGCVFSRKAAVVSELTMHLDRHVQNLDALHGIQEYTVQLKIIGAPKTGHVIAGSGRAFLQMQRARRTARDNLHQDRRVFAQKVLDQLHTPTVQIENQFIRFVVGSLRTRQTDAHSLLTKTIDTTR